MRIGVVGVGRIGAPLVARLVAAGHEVVAADVRAERRQVVVEAGARWAASSAQAAAAREVVVTALPGGPELRAAVLGPDSLLSHMSPGAIWVDVTSASAELGRECALRAREYGVGYLDAPIGGGVPAMREGAVTLYVGGDSEVLAAAEPVLRAFAAEIHHMGQDNGSGYLVKLLINVLWFGQAALTTEALLVARSLGVPAERMQSVLGGSAGDSAFAARHLPALLQGDYLRDFGLDRCVEELDSVELTAGRAGMPHPLTAAIALLHREALDRFGRVDGELMGPALLEERAGSPLSEA